ncbi:MAG TPA: two-component regulator propeller domain-containing protein, partial [Caulifigura sp.]|nr:two-component regulator propeller domain-containing protein [Caulifigura sp.]
RYDGQTLYRLKIPPHPRENVDFAKTPPGPSSPYETYCIRKDRRGHVWIGTLARGACRYDGHSWDWLFEKHLRETPAGGAFGIRSIFEDRQGDFCICNTRYRFQVQPPAASAPTANILKYERQPGVASFRTQSGDDHIYFMSILDDDDGNLWMATYDDGIWKYDGKSMTRFAVVNGNQPVRTFSMSKDRQAVLWLGTAAGPFRFNGSRFEKFKP